MFITFEGIDSSGKSTQLQKLAEYLISHNKRVLILREPGGTPVAEAIRSILLNKQFSINAEEELLLFTAARANLVKNVISPEVKKGNIVLCDRFYDSTTAYQSFGRGLNREFVNKINNFATQNLKPDFTFVIDIPVDEMIKRSQTSKKINDRMEENKIDFFEKVRNGYLILSQEEPERIKIIDGVLPIEQVHDAVLKFVLQKNKLKLFF
ncbi:MAG: dTMP kinase [Bacteroidetes bacterium]|nr:dTMP kinase [Bacteroidota bacterium]